MTPTLRPVQKGRQGQGSSIAPDKRAPVRLVYSQPARTSRRYAQRTRVESGYGGSGRAIPPPPNSFCMQFGGAGDAKRNASSKRKRGGSTATARRSPSQHDGKSPTK